MVRAPTMTHRIVRSFKLYHFPEYSTQIRSVPEFRVCSHFSSCSRSLKTGLQPQIPKKIQKYIFSGRNENIGVLQVLYEGPPLGFVCLQVLQVGQSYSQRNGSRNSVKKIVWSILDQTVKKWGPAGGFCMLCMLKKGPTYTATYKKSPVFSRVYGGFSEFVGLQVDFGRSSGFW